MIVALCTYKSARVISLFTASNITMTVCDNINNANFVLAWNSDLCCILFYMVTIIFNYYVYSSKSDFLNSYHLTEKLKL